MSLNEHNGLTKKFKELCVVDHVDLDVGNEVFGLLGPNGAGKSAIVKMLTTLTKPTKAYICGYDTVKCAAEVRNAISYVPQEMALYTKLIGRESVMLFAELYGVKDKNARADMVSGYLGGMRRRLEIAQALVHEPRVLFLDESTIVAGRGCQTEDLGTHLYVKREGDDRFYDYPLYGRGLSVLRPRGYHR